MQVDESAIVGSFLSADAGSNKVVTIAAGETLLVGADAANYSPMIAFATTATIEQATQTLEFTTDAPDPAIVGDTYTPAVSSSAVRICDRQ